MTQSRIAHLKEMVVLEQHREALQRQIDDVVNKLIGIRNSISSKTSSALSLSAASSPKKVGRPAKGAKAAPAAPVKAIKTGKSGRVGRGVLKEQIFSALQSAGSAGVYVKELAQSLNMKPVNIHAWFHAAVKRYPNVHRIDGGHYRLNGSSKGADKKSVEKKADKKSTSAARKAVPAKTSSGRSPRGELTSRVLAALENAGSAGISLTDLSEELGIPYKHISVWFSTTGKKNSRVKRVSRGQYRLA